MSDFFDDNPEQLAIDPAYSGSRATASAEGAIYDASDIGRQCGFRWPIAVTKAVWENCVLWTDDDTARQAPQNQGTRLYDLISSCADCVRTRGPKTDRMRFRVDCVQRDGTSRRKRSILLQVVAHPGDEGEPVLTVRVPVQ